MTGKSKYICSTATGLLLLLTACSGGGSGSDSPASDEIPAATSEVPEPTDTPTVEEMSMDELTAWVEDLNSQDPRRIKSSQRHAVEGSIAQAYGSYRLHTANSNIDGGYPQDAHDVTAAGNTVQSCPGGDEACAKFANFEQTDGKVQSFTVNGKELEKRLVNGPGQPVPVSGLATVQFLVAYRSVSSDTLVVVVKLKAGAQPINIIDASYRAANGRQSQSELISGPAELGARSSATYTMGYPGAMPGGSATLRFYTDGSPIPATVGVPRAN